MSFRNSVRGNPGKSQFKFDESTLGHVQRSVFDRSHGHKTTFNEGQLIPILVDEVLPGDTFNLRMSALCRMTTPIYPIMDNLYLESFWFFVPYRLLWTNWELFNGAQESTPSDSTSYILPTLTSPVGGVATGDLSDYFGLPIGIANYPVTHSLHHRAYNLIWNQWFRDENLQNAVTVELDNGPDTYANYTVLTRGKRKDYFTSALPWTQKINDGTVVGVGLVGTAPVLGIGKYNQVFDVPGTAAYESGGTHPTYAHAVGINIAFTQGTFYVQGTADSGGYPNIRADLSQASAITINSLRQAYHSSVFDEPY